MSVDQLVYFFGSGWWKYFVIFEVGIRMWSIVGWFQDLLVLYNSEIFVGQGGICDFFQLVFFDMICRWVVKFVGDGEDKIVDRLGG